MFHHSSPWASTNVSSSFPFHLLPCNNLAIFFLWEIKFHVAQPKTPRGCALNFSRKNILFNYFEQPYHHFQCSERSSTYFDSFGSSENPVLTKGSLPHILNNPVVPSLKERVANVFFPSCTVLLSYFHPRVIFSSRYTFLIMFKHGICQR